MKHDENFPELRVMPSHVLLWLTRCSKHKDNEFTMKFENEKQQTPVLFCLAFLTILVWEKN